MQFYGLAAPRAGTCAVHEFWNERLRQLTVHAGERSSAGVRDAHSASATVIPETDDLAPPNLRRSYYPG